VTTELTPDQVAGYLEASCALIDSEFKALGDDAGWHQASGEWCAREVVGHIIEAEKRGFAGRTQLVIAASGEPPLMAERVAQCVDTEVFEPC
jgi:hypothetical protein